MVEIVLNSESWFRSDLCHNFLGENLSVLSLNFVVLLPSSQKIHKCKFKFQIKEESATERWMKIFYLQTSCFNNVPSEMACKSVFDAFRTIVIINMDRRKYKCFFSHDCQVVNYCVNYCKVVIDPTQLVKLMRLIQDLWKRYSVNVTLHCFESKPLQMTAATAFFPHR